MKKSLNLSAVLVIIFYPLVLLTIASFYIYKNGVGFFEIMCFIISYYICNISVGVGLHRLWSHNSYKVNKIVEFLLALTSAATLQGPALSWASNHFKHHTYTDTDKDPHSPLKYKSKIKGFLWSHVGWMLIGEGSSQSIDRVTMVKLGRNKILRWQLKYYWRIAFLMNIVPFFVGYIFGGDLTHAFGCFIFMGIGRAVQHQVTFFVNSLCHFFGKNPYTSDSSRDVWWLALFLLGENWHNFHHAFPADYRNGFKWYQFDVHKWIIYLMYKVGLAWDLKKTEMVRIEAKVKKNTEVFVHNRRAQLDLLQIKVYDLMNKCQEKIVELENSSVKLREKFYKKLEKYEGKLIDIREQLQLNFEDPSDKLIKVITKKVKNIEKYILTVI